ncbi:MAG: DUF1206 domain-containing protein [Limnothrix sp.]
MTSQKLSASEPAKWIELSARIGYTAKGIVYLLIGVLAFLAAFNWGGEMTGSEGAFKAVAAKPLGNIVLFLIGAGLLCYVFWRFIQAIYDPEHDDSGFGSIGRRLSSFISGLVYGAVAFSAFEIAFEKFFGSSDSGGGGNEEQTEFALSQPFGRWLVALVGVAIVAYGFYCFYEVIAAKFRRKLNLKSISEETEKWLMTVARFGLFAKGIVSTIIGYFLISAAKSFDSNQTKSTEGALQVIQQQPYGAILVGIIAVGMVSYGGYYVIQARYRKISPG